MAHANIKHNAHNQSLFRTITQQGQFTSKLNRMLGRKQIVRFVQSAEQFKISECIINTSWFTSTAARQRWSSLLSSQQRCNSCYDSHCTFHLWQHSTTTQQWQHNSYAQHLVKTTDRTTVFLTMRYSLCKWQTIWAVSSIVVSFVACA